MSGKQSQKTIIQQLSIWTLLIMASLPIRLFAAEVFFQDVYKGLGGPYAEETSAISISAASKVVGTNFSFTSLDPTVARFTGNNVPGFFKYTDAGGNVVTIRGVVSRPEKSGSTFRAVYFYTSDANDNPLGDAYLFVFPGFEAVFAVGGDIGTSSDPVETALNSLLDSQVPTPGLTVSTTALTNFSTCAGTASPVQSFTVAGSSLTAGIDVTAPAGYEISLTNNSGFGNTLSIPLPSGSTAIAATTVYVRLTATATNGATGNIVCSSTGATDKSVATGTGTVNALPTPTAASTTYPTTGSTLTLSATGGTSYQWTGPNGFTSLVQNPTIANITSANAGTYTVKVTNSSGCSATAQVTVVIYADNDGDGLADVIDLDDDNDGVLDAVENAACTPSSAQCDTDGDGIINAFDLDADGDGVSDVYEAGGTDVNCDGKADGANDANGVPLSANGGLVVPDDDNDGKKNTFETDSNNDGIPDGEVVLIYKTASEPTLLADGTYNMKFAIRLKNNRNKTVTSITVKDDLSLTFKSPAIFTITGITNSGSSLIRNISYNGRSTTDLLANTSTLPANGTDSIVITVNVDPKGLSGTQSNTASVTATAGCQTLSRQSIDLSRSGGVAHGNGVPTQFNLKPIDIFIADVLTPNNDGYNDKWYIVFPRNKQLNVTVYNRWGQEVYKNSNYNNEWDGKGTGNFLGKDLPNGTYFYLVEITDRSGSTSKEVRKGSLTLKRSY